jgi:energy-coupling factor transport system ATP-binding protein
LGLLIDNITYIYNEGSVMATNAIDGVTCEIPDGQFIGLIGHTGSGKSTLVQTMNGLLRPSSGKILYNGEDIWGENYDRRKLRAEVGLVFQYPEHQLFEADVLTDVKFGPKNLGLSQEEQERRAKKALELVGMGEEYYEVSPFELSGGQKRRAAIAGVLAMEPKIMILDEPTAGLDPKGRDEILGLVSDMHTKLHMTIVLVSHSMDDVAKYVERIIVMNNAKIMLDGTPREVFRHGEELENVGLSEPQVVYICQYLKQRGMNIPKEVLTVDEAAQAILKAAGKKESENSGV